MKKYTQTARNRNFIASSRKGQTALLIGESLLSARRLGLLNRLVLHLRSQTRQGNQHGFHCADNSAWYRHCIS